jgi:hypothetical protein
VLFLRIRQAEVALHDGRLDEAYELVAQSEKLRSHRRGQSLVTRLVTALVKRGHEHLAASRPQQALVDCDKAARLGGNLPEVVELRDAASGAIDAKRRSERRHAQALLAARQAIEAGRLAAGQELLAAAGDESRAVMLLADVNVRRAMVETALQSAQVALDRGDLDLAASELCKARSSDATDARVIDLTLRICKALKQRVASALDEGRLDLADSLVQRLAKLDEEGSETRQHQRALEQSRLAWESIDRGQPRQAEEILRRLSNLLPDARWIKEALKFAAQAEEALQSLRGGPLGLLSSSRAPTEAPMPIARITGFQPVPAPAAHGLKTRDSEMRDTLPSRFVIQVDGAGSFVVVRQPMVTLGPVSSSKMPDVGLIAEPGAPVVTIERNDDDYFIRATGQIAINERAVTSKLLMKGDRIAISPRCRLAFNLPNAASTSATIDLSGGRFPRSDVRRVILLDRDLVIGPGNGTHIRAEQLSGNVVLLVRDNRLFVQSETMVTVDGKPMDRAAGIPLGGHVDVGGLSFVVTRG